MLEINQVHQGDCLDLLPLIPDASVDMVLTSPPYDKLRTCYNYDFDFEGVAKQLYRIVKQGGVVVWIVGDAVVDGSETGTSFRQALYFKEIGFNLHDTMIYQKPGFSNPDSTRYHSSFEYMFIFSIGQPKTFNPIKDRLNFHSSSLAATTHRNADGSFSGAGKKTKCDIYGKRFNIWKIKTVAQESPCQEQIHPAAFTETLAKDHILSWSNECDLVCDPMLGSGTAAVAALNTSRNFIGIELSEEYCKIARERIARETRQERMKL